MLSKIERAERHPSKSLAERADGLLKAGGELIQAWLEYEQEKQRLRKERAEKQVAELGLDTLTAVAAAPAAPMLGTAGDSLPEAETPPVLPGPPAGGADEVGTILIPCLNGDGRIVLMPVQRRALLLGGIGTTLAAGAHPWNGLGADSTRALEELRHDVTPSLSGGEAVTNVEEWHEIAAEYGQRYMRTAPADLMVSLSADIAALRTAIERAPGSHTAELRSAGAYLVAFMAMTTANVGDNAGARRWWWTARQAADAGGDPGTILWVRAREAIDSCYLDRQPQAIVRLAEETEAKAGKLTPSAGAHFLLDAKAQALSHMGRKDEAEATLARLGESFFSLAVTPRSHEESTLNYSEDCLRYVESMTYTHLRDFGKADAAQTAALTIHAGRRPRGTAEVELHRAQCLIGTGDVPGGLSHATAIVTALPVKHRVLGVRNLAVKTLNAVPRSEQNRPAVTEYRDTLSGVFGLGATAA